MFKFNFNFNKFKKKRSQMVKVNIDAIEYENEQFERVTIEAVPFESNLPPCPMTFSNCITDIYLVLGECKSEYYTTLCCMAADEEDESNDKLIPIFIYTLKDETKIKTNCIFVGENKTILFNYPENNTVRTFNMALPLDELKWMKSIEELNWD